MKISFITDEVTQSFDEAVRFARQNGLAGLELRSVEDTAIDMLPAETLRTWRRRLDAEGLTVCGLAGSFYKCAPEPDAVEAELAKLERLCAAADILGCAFIRGFAFFAPEEGPLPAETLAPYFERPVRLLEQRGKTLLLEADGLRIGVASFPTVKPLDEAYLSSLCGRVPVLFTLEEHTIVGGFGGAVCEYVCGLTGPRPRVVRLGLNDTYCSVVGNQSYLEKHFGLDAESVARRVRQELGMA